MNMVKPRENWVDNVKVFACILVVLGHFFQSMTKSEILPANLLYLWFNQTVYYFHVPLFFICSGYLYQNYSSVNNMKNWTQSVLKKFITLGVPYFTFSLVTWILKRLFSSSVNGEVGGLIDALFIHPQAPYWYLFALFLLFVITPTICRKKEAVILLSLSVILKLLSLFSGGGVYLQLIMFFLMRFGLLSVCV